MRKLSIITAAILGLSIIAAPAANAWPVKGHGNSGTSQSGKGKQKKPKEKTFKNVPQASLDAGLKAQARRGAGRHLPEPKTKGKAPARGVTILVPGASKPTRPGQRVTSAEIAAARQAVRQSPGPFYSQTTASGRRFGFLPDGSRPGAIRGGAPVAGPSGEASNAGPSNKRYARRFNLDKNGNPVDSSGGGSTSN
ncbi:MAG: hypothetical protein R3C60_09345 [Parvularculaceae bacterium]